MSEDRSVDAEGSERVMRVLWGLETTATRGPRPTISRESIVGVAVRLADRSGLPALSMRAVAEELGAGTMSLYRHVPGKAELVALMVDLVAGETELPEPTDGDWRSPLERLARGEWELYHRHPWLLQVPLGRTPPGPRTTKKFDAGLALAVTTGLPTVEALSVYFSIDQLVLGAARASVENQTFLRDSGVNATQWWEEQGELLSDLADWEALPTLHALVECGAFDAWNEDGMDGFADAFEYALALLLDGVAARVERHTG